MALVVLAVVGYAAFRAVTSVIGGDSGESSSTNADVANEADIDCSGSGDAELCAELGFEGGVLIPVPGSAVGSEPTQVTDPTVPESIETEPDVPEDTGPPSQSNPADVFIVGDSDAGTFGPYLQTLLEGTLIVETELNYKVSSGLARPDFYNWPEEISKVLPEVDPDIVVVTFGGNDAQGLSKPQPELEWVVNDPLLNQEEWMEEYERRVGDFMDLLIDDGRRVIWVGIPNDDNPDVTARLALQDSAAKAAAADRPDVVFIDTWSRFSGRDGGWAEFVVDPRDGVGKDVRHDDGFHLNQAGAEILAIDIAVAVQEELRDLGASI